MAYETFFVRENVVRRAIDVRIPWYYQDLIPQQILGMVGREIITLNYFNMPTTHPFSQYSKQPLH